MCVTVSIYNDEGGVMSKEGGQTDDELAFGGHERQILGLRRAQRDEHIGILPQSLALFVDYTISATPHGLHTHTHHCTRRHVQEITF